MCRTTYSSASLPFLPPFPLFKGKTVVNKMLPAAEHKGFTGLEVFNMKIADLFKGTSIKESFLLFNVSNTGTYTSGSFTQYYSYLA